VKSKVSARIAPSILLALMVGAAALTDTSTASALPKKNYCSAEDGRRCTNGGRCICHREGTQTVCVVQCFPPRSNAGLNSSPTAGHRPIQNGPPIITRTRKQ
jgi:hypothetical protein